MYMNKKIGDIVAVDGTVVQIKKIFKRNDIRIDKLFGSNQSLSISNYNLIRKNLIPIIRMYNLYINLNILKCLER